MSKNNINEVNYSSKCYCYNCMSEIKPNEISKFSGTGAVCPRCGDITIIPDVIDFDITLEFLESMKKFWC